METLGALANVKSSNDCATLGRGSTPYRTRRNRPVSVSACSATKPPRDRPPVTDIILPPRARPTQDALLDTFKLEYLVPVVAVLSLIINYAFTPFEILWSFSIWLESVAILPQLFMLQRTGEAETITTHYLAALGLYRGLYIPNWIYR
jgi:hypothetical protein